MPKIKVVRATLVQPPRDLLSTMPCMHDDTLLNYREQLPNEFCQETGQSSEVRSRKRSPFHLNALCDAVIVSIL